MPGTGLPWENKQRRWFPQINGVTLTEEELNKRIKTKAENRKKKAERKAAMRTILSAHKPKSSVQKKPIHLPRITKPKNEFEALVMKNPIRFATPQMRKDVFQRDAGQCQYCGKELEYNTCVIDHVIPWPEGMTVVDNLVVACPKCNEIKLRQFIPINLRPIPGVATAL